jgi:hypothetical protein
MHGWGCPNHVKLSNLPLYDSCCFLIYEVCLLYIKKWPNVSMVNIKTDYTIVYVNGG